MAKGRKKLEINKADLQYQIDLIEKTNTFATQGELWKAIENTDWAKNQKPRALKASVVYLRFKEFNCTAKTQPGKRGGTLTQDRIEKMQANRGARTSRADKNSTPERQQHFKLLRKNSPKTLEKLIGREEKGSLMAMIKGNCLDCIPEQGPGAESQREQICNCPAKGICHFWPARPYQKNAKDEDETPVQKEAA